MTPRIAHTAKTLWLIYALFTLLETGLLWAVGMTPLEALNHALTTMSTGGFSTRNAGVGHYQSASIEMIITVFMFLAGLNFALHFQVLRGRGRVMLSDPEARLYTGIVVVATVLIAGDLIQHMGHTVLDGCGWRCSRCCRCRRRRGSPPTTTTAGRSSPRRCCSR